MYPNSTAHSLTLSLSKKSRLDLASSALFKPPLTNVVHVPRQKATGRDTAARERWVIAARPRDFSARLSASARHADANALTRRDVASARSSSSCLRRSRRARTPSSATHRASRSDRTRGVDTFTKVLSKPTTVSRLEHVVRGRMKRARRGDGRQAPVAALVGALVAISIAPLRARAAPFPADGANLRTAIDNCLTADATGACDCSSVDCKEGNGIAIGSWDTSEVVNMEQMFESKNAFNQDISGWNTAAVTTMERMFYGAAAFNGDVSAWNTAAVTTMAYICLLYTSPSPRD